MRKILYLVVALTTASYSAAEPASADLDTLKFDNLDAGLDDLAYEVDEEDIEDYAKLLDEADAGKSTSDAQTNTAKTSGFKKKNASKKRTQSNRNVQNLKKFFKSAGAQDRGAYKDDDVYANADALAAQAVGIKGKEDRKYRKGTKTRGFHRVHHKDEYKKDKVIYEDDKTKGSINKVGAKALGYKIGAGAGVSRRHFHHDRRKGLNGREAYSEKGISDKQFKEFSDSQGFDAAFDNDK